MTCIRNSLRRNHNKVFKFQQRFNCSYLKPPLTQDFCLYGYLLPLKSALIYQDLKNGESVKIEEAKRLPYFFQIQTWRLYHNTTCRLHDNTVRGELVREACGYLYSRIVVYETNLHDCLI